jgi:nicotinate-nucleotide pyrophosphorylase (carboxylating)
MSTLDPQTLHLIDLALQEDGADLDITTLWTVPENATAKATLLSREAGILCGADLFTAVFHRLDPNLEVQFNLKDKASLSPNQNVAQLSGRARPILSGERLALNLIGRLSGIATQTSQFVKAVEGTAARICDTRKTTPLWRKWEKYAVLTGGGVNHRMGLSDMVLIKDNHIALAGGSDRAWDAVHESNIENLDAEIEVETLDQLRTILDRGATRLLLDNMTPELLRKAVEITQKRAVLEASGGIRLENVRAIAETGVDLISVGALTHSVKCFDFSLEIYQEPPDTRRY